MKNLGPITNDKDIATKEYVDNKAIVIDEKAVVYNDDGEITTQIGGYDKSGTLVIYNNYLTQSGDSWTGQTLETLDLTQTNLVTLVWNRGGSEYAFILQLPASSDSSSNTVFSIEDLGLECKTVVMSILSDSSTSQKLSLTANTGESALTGISGDMIKLLQDVEGISYINSDYIEVDEKTINRNGNEIQVKNGGITATQLADGAVNSYKLLDGNVTFDKLATALIVKIIRDATGALDTNLPTEKAVRTQLDLKVSIADVIDNLTSSDTVKPLSANQGKVLKALIDALSGAVAVKKVDTLPTSPAKSTMYYVGTAAPYHIYLYDSDGVQNDLGTNELKLENYVKITDIVNDLTTGGTAVPLSAEQGKVLNNALGNYLPLSGGTMSGIITIASFAGIGMVNSNNGGEISFWGGTGSDSSMLRLMGKENSYSPGAWILSSGDGTNFAQLEGHADDTLTWGNSSLTNILSDTNGFQIASSRISEKSIDDVVALASVDGSNKFLPLVIFTASDAPEGSNSDTYSVKIEKYNSSFYKITAYNYSTGKTWQYTNVWGTKSGWNIICEKKIASTTTNPQSPFSFVSSSAIQIAPHLYYLNLVVKNSTLLSSSSYTLFSSGGLLINGETPTPYQSLSAASALYGHALGCGISSSSAVHLSPSSSIIANSDIVIQGMITTESS